MVQGVHCSELRWCHGVMHAASRASSIRAAIVWNDNDVGEASLTRLNSEPTQHTSLRSTRIHHRCGGRRPSCCIGARVPGASVPLRTIATRECFSSAARYQASVSSEAILDRPHGSKTLPPVSGPVPSLRNGCPTHARERQAHIMRAQASASVVAWHLLCCAAASLCLRCASAASHFN